MPAFPCITTPITLGDKLTLTNRLYFSSVGFDLCDNSGRPLPEFHKTYETLMDGGCGFGFLANASVDPVSQYTDRGLKIVSRAHAEDLRPSIDAAAIRGFPLGVQLQHYGMQGATGHAAINDLSLTEIDELIDQFVSSARFAAGTGAQIVQIHAANGYLLSSFLSPATNRRVDRWGGSPINRAAILLSILQRTRAVLPDIVLFVRLQIDDGLGRDGLHYTQLGEVVSAIEEAGADAITFATGVSETFAKFLGDRDYSISTSRGAGRFLKRSTGLPVGFAGNMDQLSVAEEIVSSGDADFIGFGRAIIADPELVNKERAGLNSAVIRCRWDSYCLRDKKEPAANRVYCCVNPAYLRPQHIQNKYEELR